MKILGQVSLLSREDSSQEARVLHLQYSFNKRFSQFLVASLIIGLSIYGLSQLIIAISCLEFSSSQYREIA